MRAYPWILTFALILLPQVQGTSPCIPIQYSVTYSQPLWVVSLSTSNQTGENMWYWAPEDRSYRPMAPKVNTSPSPAEPVTFMDGVLTGIGGRSDEIRVWDPERFWVNLTVAWGVDANHISGSQGFWLQDGYSSSCMGGPPSTEPTSPIPPSVVVVSAAALAGGLGASALLLPRRPPRPPGRA